MTTPELIVSEPALNGTTDWVSNSVYWQAYYDHPHENYEWNNGQLEVKPMSSVVEFELYLWFMQLLNAYLTVQPVGQIVGLETGFEMLLPHKSSVRKPDIAFVHQNNPIPLLDTARRYEGIFDLCVESVSASSRKEIERDTVDKRQEYALAGVQEYYILDERGIETAFLRNVGGRFQPLPEVSGIIRSTLLSGFQFRRRDLSSRPSLERLALDTVYQGYVLLSYQQERQQREMAQRQREQAQHEAQTERQQRELAQREAQQAQHEAEEARSAKEKLAAKLRELGIDPTELQ